VSSLFTVWSFVFTAEEIIAVALFCSPSNIFIFPSLDLSCEPVGSCDYFTASVLLCFGLQSFISFAECFSFCQI
jgi:hypothetical protein